MLCSGLWSELDPVATKHGLMNSLQTQGYCLNFPFHTLSSSLHLFSSFLLAALPLYMPWPPLPPPVEETLLFKTTILFALLSSVYCLSLEKFDASILPHTVLQGGWQLRVTDICNVMLAFELQHSMLFPYPHYSTQCCTRNGAGRLATKSDSCLAVRPSVQL